MNGKHIVDSAIGPLNVEYAAGEAERLNLPTTAEGTSVKLFVGGVPLAMSDDELRDYFSAHGQVTECHILPQKTSNPVIQTKAAFVRFARKADGLKAIEILDKKVAFPGVERTMDVRVAEGRETKPEDRQGARTFQQPQQMGQRFPTHQQQPRPMAPMAPIAPVPMRPPRTIGVWTEYYAPDGRPYYYNSTTGVTCWDPPAEFRMAGPPAPPPPAYMQQPMGGYSGAAAGAAPQGNTAAESKGPTGANLFVFHVPAEWTESDLYTQFSPYGNLLSYRIAREKETNRPKGFAFVSYDNAGSGQAAIGSLNGMIVSNGKRLKVSVKKGEEGFAGGPTAYAQPY